MSLGEREVHTKWNQLVQESHCIAPVHACFLHMGQRRLWSCAVHWQFISFVTSVGVTRVSRVVGLYVAEFCSLRVCAIVAFLRISISTCLENSLELILPKMLGKCMVTNSFIKIPVATRLLGSMLNTSKSFVLCPGSPELASLGQIRMDHSLHRRCTFCLTSTIRTGVSLYRSLKYVLAVSSSKLNSSWPMTKIILRPLSFISNRGHVILELTLLWGELLCGGEWGAWVFVTIAEAIANSLRRWDAWGTFEFWLLREQYGCRGALYTDFQEALSMRTQCV